MPRSRNGVFKNKGGVNMSLLAKPASRYVGTMKLAQPISLSTTVWVALGVASFAAAAGIGFAAWLDKDAGIFMSLVEAGMSWCF